MTEPVEEDDGGGRLAFARTSVATRLAASVVAVAVVSLAVATIVGVTTGEQLADDINDERLRGTVESAAFDVGAQLRSLGRTTDALSVSTEAPILIESFDAAFAELAADVEGRSFDDEIDELVTTYQQRYLDPLREAGRDAQLRDIIGSSIAAAFLQYEYAVDLGSVSQPSSIDDADDGSTWTEIHRIVHPVYRDVVNDLDLLDLYLVGTDGRVLYSVRKRADLGTNLETGPFSGSVVADAFVAVKDDPDGGAATTDLSFYDPWPGVPVGVVGTAIVDDGRFVGAVLISYDGAELTRLVTGDGAYEKAGLPESGDVYVLGADGSLRSDPRSFVEDPSAHLAASQAAGTLNEADAQRVQAVGTTVLTQRAADGTRAAQRSANTDVGGRTSLTGLDVLTVVVPVEGADLAWSVVAEMDSDIAGNRLDDFQQLLIVGAAIFVVIVAFLAVGWANGIVRPIRQISDRIARGARSEDPIEVAPQSPVEIQLLASQLDVMRHTLYEQQDQLAHARRERLDLLRSMLPPSVAQRIATGDVQSLDQAPAATVVVVVVLGLADLVRADSEHADREMVDQLHAELDALAAQHGLDRIKVVGDAYFAVCGHDRQYIDHAPRAMRFALDAETVVHGVDSPVELDIAIGVHSGPVTTGTAGGAKLVYDVWGETVAQAHLLARQANSGEIRLTDSSRVLLPESIATETVDADHAISRVAGTAEGATSR